MIIPALLIGGGIATVASHAYDSRKQGTHSPLRKSPRRRKRKRLVRELSTTDHHSSTNPLLSTNHILAQQAPAKLATGIGLMTVGGALWWANAHGLTAVVLTNRLIAFSSKSSFGAPLFLAVYTVAPLVFFPSSLLTIASGVLFGSVKGFGLSFVGCMASASIAYGIGHRLRMTAADSEGNLTLELNTAASDGRGKNAIDLSRFSSLTSYVERMKENPFATMVTMHLLFLPFDLVSYSAGQAV